MILCFGTYANALKKCSLDTVTIQFLVSTLVKTIDKNERYSGTELSNSSRLFNCKSDFAQPRRNAGEAWDKGLSTIMNRVSEQQPEALELASEFDKLVIPLLDEDKKRSLVFILKDIVKSDPSIDENKRKFKRYTTTMPEVFLKSPRMDLGLVLAGLFLYILTSTKNTSNSDTLREETISTITSDEYFEQINSRTDALDLKEARLGTKRKDSSHVPARTVGADDSANETTHMALRRRNFSYMWEIDMEEFSILPPDFIDDYDQYADAAADKYSTIKTLLSHDNPIPFYDLYVYNDVLLAAYSAESNSNLRRYVTYCNSKSLDSGIDMELGPYSVRTKKPITISHLTPIKLGLVSRFSILTGTGGLGKSVMLQHLMLSCAKDIHGSGQVPLFVSLKDMKPEYESLIDLLYEFNKGLLSPTISKEKLEEDLRQGGFLILLDALDEISSSLHAKFDEMLNNFIDEYYNNQFIVSSRPYDTFKSYARFTVYTLQPLSKKQAIQLIENTEFRPAEPHFKDNFLAALNDNLYDNHKDFAENPLLLNIMLMTFAYTGGISAKMHLFYRDAYRALSFDHDYNKGNYERPLATGLDPEVFGHYLEEFCAISYKKEDYDYTWDKIDSYLRNLKIKERDHANFTTRDFIFDLEHNLCLLFFEANEYHYVHRSFQEYFTAVHYSHKKDKYLYNIGLMFEKKANKSRNRDNKAFEMLYDMIPEKVEEYVFLPFLNELFNKCHDDNPIIQYLKVLGELYNELSFYTGEVPYISYNVPSTFMYSFIIKAGGFAHSDIYECPNTDPPLAEVYAEKTFYFGEYDEDSASYDVIDEDDLQISSLDTEPPEVAGYFSVYPISVIFDEEAIDEELLDYFTDENFLFWKEYKELEKYYNKLLDESQANDDDDIFDEE